MNIDWELLKKEANNASKKAYAPYSNFPVGAAGFVSDGLIVNGCNIENASYGLTLCAECSMISNLLMSGGGRLIAVVCVDEKGELLSPCGRCSQLLFVHGGNELQLLTPSRPQNMSAILPWGFGRDDLEKKK